MSHCVPDEALPLERGLPRLGAGQQDRGQHRQHEQREQRVAHAQAGRQRAVEHAGTGQADGGQQARHHRQPHHVDPHVEEEGHAGPQDDLERQELEPDRGRLAQEDPGRVDAREAKPVARALARLDGDAALNRQHRREQQRHPEDPRRGVAQRGLVGSDGEREAAPGRGRRRGRPATARRRAKRASIRRSLPATSTASCHMDGPRRCPRPGPRRRHRGERDAAPARLLAGHPAAAHGDDAVGQGDRELRLVRREQHASPRPTRPRRSAARAARARRRRGRRAARRAATGRAGGRAARPARPGAAGRPRAPAGVVRRRPVRPSRSSASSAAPRREAPRARTAKWTFSAALSSS